MSVFKSRGGKLVAGTVVVLVAAGGGAAFAATQLDSPGAHDNAIISDAAGQLGVQPSALSSALKKAYDDQIQAKVTSGELSQSQADALKKSVDAGNIPLFSGGGGPGPGGARAAARLGRVRVRVRPRRRLERGRDLPRPHGRPDQVRPPERQDARPDRDRQGKTADGLVQAILSRQEANLDKLVTAGKLSSDQEKNIEKGLDHDDHEPRQRHPSDARCPSRGRRLRLLRRLRPRAASAPGSASARSAPT